MVPFHVRECYNLYYRIQKIQNTYQGALFILKTKNMTQGTPWKLILAVALPLMLGNVFQQLYTVVDTAIVGNVLGVTALAALGASDWFNWMFMMIIQGLTQGFTIPVAQEYGAGDVPRLRRNAATAIKLSAIFGVVLCAAALLTITPVLKTLNTPESILPTSRNYLIVLFSGTPILMAYNLLAGFLRALGDGKSPLIAMVIASVINIALDILFVAGFGWGVEGAAAATVIAQAFSALYCYHCFRKIDVLHLSRKDFMPERSMTFRQLRLGTPLALQNIVICVGGMVLQSIVNNMGVLFIAGYTATNKLYGILEVAATSSGYAISTYMGQNLGARKFGRIRKGMRSALIMSVIISAVIGLSVMALGKPLLSLFITGTVEEVAESMKYGYEYLIVMCLGLPVLYVLHAYKNALQGFGNTISPMISGFAEFIMRTGAALILPAFVGYWGIFLAEVLAWAGADVILLFGYYKAQSQFPRLDENILQTNT